MIVVVTFASNWSRSLISLSSLLAPCFEISVLPSALPSSLRWLPSQPTSAPNSLYLCSPLATATKQRPAEVGMCQLWSFPVTSSCDLIPEWARTAAISVSIQPVIPKPSEPQLCTAKIMTCVCVCICVYFHWIPFIFTSFSEIVLVRQTSNITVYAATELPLWTGS